MMNGVLIVVLFVAILVAGFFLWMKITSRMNPPVQPPAEDPIVPMTSEQIDSIEAALNVKLPQAVRNFLGRDREKDEPDETMLMPWPEAIIEGTLEYRKGFHEKMSKWPDRFVCLGDQGDACAYALDCESGEILYTDKGNLDRKPLEHYASFEDWLALCRTSHA